MTLFFTADMHLGHSKIIEFCKRPFEDVDEMDKELIFRWNSRVKPEDTVYHIGDFCWSNPRSYLDRLNGQIFLINGSHDKASRAYVLKDRILEIEPIQDGYGNPRTLVMCHYSLRSWPKSHYASWHLFGHHHGKLEPYGLSFDVGVDAFNFYPVSLGEVSKIMATLKPIVDFRKPL